MYSRIVCVIITFDFYSLKFHVRRVEAEYFEYFRIRNKYCKFYSMRVKNVL